MTEPLTNDQVTLLLDGLVGAEVIDDVLADRRRYETTPVVELGVDSLAVMELLARVEGLAGVEVDFDTFDMRDLATLGSITALLDGLRDRS